MARRAAPIPVTCNEVKLRAVAAAAVVTFRSARWATSMTAEPVLPIAVLSAAPSDADMMQLGNGTMPALHTCTIFSA